MIILLMMKLGGGLFFTFLGINKLNIRPAAMNSQAQKPLVLSVHGGSFFLPIPA